MNETGKAAQISAEVTTYKLLVLAQMDRVSVYKIVNWEAVLYSRHDHADDPHTEGVGFILTPQAAIHRLVSSIIQNHHGHIPHQDQKSHLHPVLRTYKRS